MFAVITTNYYTILPCATTAENARLASTTSNNNTDLCIISINVSGYKHFHHIRLLLLLSYLLPTDTF